jgi:hypothetical protein
MFAVLDFLSRTVQLARGARIPIKISFQSGNPAGAM